MANASNPALTAAFTAVLRRQELIAPIVAVPALAWLFLRCWRGGAATGCRRRGRRRCLDRTPPRMTAGRRLVAAAKVGQPVVNLGRHPQHVARPWRRTAGTGALVLADDRAA